MRISCRQPEPVVNQAICVAWMVMTLALAGQASAQSSNVILDPGDIYRIGFRVNLAALPTGFVPDGGVLVLNVATCTGRVDMTVNDGYRVVGYRTHPELTGGATDCSLANVFAGVSVSSGLVGEFDDLPALVTGAIDGHVDIRAVTRTEFIDQATSHPWQILLCNRSFSCVGAGVTYLSRTIVAAPSIPRPAVPVVFVHGTCSGNDTWSAVRSQLDGGGWRFGGALTDPLNTAAQLSERNDRSADYYLVQFTQKGIQGGIDDWARELALYLERISSFRTGNPSQSQFIVVAHSAGGLAARYYVESTSYSGNLLHLITYGTPHLGIPHADWTEPIVKAAECGDVGLTAAYLRSEGFSQLTQGSAFLHALNDQLFPTATLFTSLIGARDLLYAPLWCRELPFPPFLGTSYLLDGLDDCVVQTGSANMASVHSPPANAESAMTTRSHTSETRDVSTILWAIGRAGVLHGVDRILIQVASPIDIIVTDPLGRTVSSTASSIPLAAYDKTTDSDGAHHAKVTIPIAISGQYRIDVLPEPDAKPQDTFGITVVRNSASTVVAEHVRVDEIPTAGYQVTLFAPITVGIDIKPDEPVASINRKSKGKIAVAILSTPTFSAIREVDPKSLSFGQSGYEQTLEFCEKAGVDSNADGLPDLVCHFSTDRTRFENTDTKGTLRGATPDGQLIVGTDSVRIVH